MPCIVYTIQLLSSWTPRCLLFILIFKKKLISNGGFNGSFGGGGGEWGGNYGKACGLRRLIDQLVTTVKIHRCYTVPRNIF